MTLLSSEDFGILRKNLQGLVFYDYAISYLPKAHYNSAGIGVHVPFGGDIVSMGSLTLAKVSLSAILFSRVNDRTSYQPSILFNLAGSF